MNNAKKQRKTIEWERLEISSRKLKRSGNISCKDGQIDGGKVEIVTDFIFLGSKITVDSDCNHEIKRCLLLERKAMKNLDSILKSKDITLLTKVCIFKAMVFPVVMYRYRDMTVHMWRVGP